MSLFNKAQAAAVADLCALSFDDARARDHGHRTTAHRVFTCGGPNGAIFVDPLDASGTSITGYHVDLDGTIVQLLSGVPVEIKQASRTTDDARFRPIPGDKYVYPDGGTLVVVSVCAGPQWLPVEPTVIVRGAAWTGVVSLDCWTLGGRDGTGTWVPCVPTPPMRNIDDVRHRPIPGDYYRYPGGVRQEVVVVDGDSVRVRRYTPGADTGEEFSTVTLASWSDQSARGGGWVSAPTKRTP